MSDDYRVQRFRGGWAGCLYRDGRRVRRVALQAQSRAEAERELSALRQDAARSAGPTVQQLVDLYIEDRAGRVIAGNMAWTWRVLAPTFATIRPHEITVDVCRAYAVARTAAGRKPGTIATELARLRLVLSWAVKRKLISEAPPIEVPARPPPRDRRLTREQIGRLLAAATMPHVRLFILLAVGTAGRSAALLGLTWSRVDFERGLIQLGTDIGRPAKGRATVPMNPGLRAALQAAQAGAESAFVIEWAGRRVGAVKRSLALAAARAGLGKVSPHDLRHSAACLMAEDGVPMDEIAQYLGHTDPRITYRVYARYSPEYLRRAAASLDFGGPGSVVPKGTSSRRAKPLR